MQAQTSAQPSATFLANRATGHIGLSVVTADGVTRRSQVHEHGSLRARFPNTHDGVLEAVIVNTGGGMTGGDRFTVDMDVGEGASLVAGTAAAEKIYRSTGPAAEMNVTLKVAAGGQLAWLPQETILFDRAKLSRHIDIDLAGDAALVMVEAVVFGRAAMGEAMAEGSFIDRWRVRRDGQLIYADTTKLESAKPDGAIAAQLGRSAVAGGAIAMATVLVAPGGADELERVRALGDSFAGEVGISAWNGVAIARLIAKDGASLRHDIIALLAALGTSVPRLWLQ